MYLTKFDPFSELRELEKKIGAIRGNKEEKDNLRGFAPSVNTRESDTGYHIEADLPGVAKEDVHVDINGDTLIISGERKTKNEIKEDDYYRMESFYGKFQRSFTLPENADKDNIKAKVENGVLEIDVPKTQPKESKKIAIE